METREEVIRFCQTFPGVYEDYPFHDDNWTVMRCGKIKEVLHTSMRETSESG